MSRGSKVRFLLDLIRQLIGIKFNSIHDEMTIKYQPRRA